eukprot:2999033-Rhodomonas_salina.2
MRRGRARMWYAALQRGNRIRRHAEARTQQALSERFDGYHHPDLPDPSRVVESYSNLVSRACSRWLLCALDPVADITSVSHPGGCVLQIAHGARTSKTRSDPHP